MIKLNLNSNLIIYTFSLKNHHQNKLSKINTKGKAHIEHEIGTLEQKMYSIMKDNVCLHKYNSHCHLVPITCMEE